MPTPDATTTGAPCWIDLFSSDTDRSRAFYGDLFGWVGEDAAPEFGGYFNFQLRGGRIAGCMHNDGSHGTPDMWSVYLRVDDAEVTAKEAAAHGGQVYVPAMPVGDLGSMVVLSDSGGAAIGGWQPGAHTGFAAVNEPGAPSWFELHTRAFGSAVDFYRDVFRWDVHAMSDTPEFRYSTLGAGDGQLAGIMDASAFLPDGAPAQWSIYFEVTDADAAVAKVTELGGTVVLPAEDTPYGRIASVADPTGATFKLRQPNAG